MYEFVGFVFAVLAGVCVGAGCKNAGLGLGVSFGVLAIALYMAGSAETIAEAIKAQKK